MLLAHAEDQGSGSLLIKSFSRVRVLRGIALRVELLSLRRLAHGLTELFFQLGKAMFKLKRLPIEATLSCCWNRLSQKTQHEYEDYTWEGSPSEDLPPYHLNILL